MGRAGTDLEIERLLEQTAVRGPECRELENEVLKRHAVGRPFPTRAAAGRAAHVQISTSSPSASRSAHDAYSAVRRGYGARSPPRPPGAAAASATSRETPAPPGTRCHQPQGIRPAAEAAS